MSESEIAEFINIHSLASSFGMLPSEVMDRGNQYDTMACVVSGAWENWNMERQRKGKEGNGNSEAAAKLLRGR